LASVLARTTAAPLWCSDSMSLPHPDLHGVYVLVVEDDPDGLDLVTSMLRWRGAVVAAAIGARDGLAAALQVRPHVVGTDIAMPGEDGYWLVDQLRAAGIDVPVIARTRSTHTPQDHEGGHHDGL
jgi:CheY-like chemotaxis protein